MGVGREHLALVIVLNGNKWHSSKHQDWLFSEHETGCQRRGIYFPAGATVLLLAGSDYSHHAMHGIQLAIGVLGSPTYMGIGVDVSGVHAGADPGQLCVAVAVTMLLLLNLMI